VPEPSSKLQEPTSPFADESSIPGASALAWSSWHPADQMQMAATMAVRQVGSCLMLIPTSCATKG